MNEDAKRDEKGRFLRKYLVPSHGRFYRLWRHMLYRCFNKKCKGYKNYGGRGISVCSRWLSFANFIEDMFSDYSYGLTIDRIDNDGDYCKENCRWADMVTQSNNTRVNRRLVYLGENKTIAEWGRKFNVDPNRIHTRFNRGWEINRIFETPFIPCPQRRYHKRSIGH